MICFDRLKIVSSTKLLNRFDESQFDLVSRNGEPQYYRYKKMRPYGLSLITVNYKKDELVIEFTSKILELKFIELINEETICECLCNIEPLVKFNEDVEDILDDFEVVKCDVTKDVSYCDIKESERFVKSNLANYDKWKCEKYRNGFVLKNVVATPKYKKRMVIYDKGNELKLEKNREFVNEVDKYDEDGSFIFDYYRYKVRVEMNINTKAQIRELLNIPDNKLTSVLSSNANPILTVLDEALKEPSVKNRSVASAWKDYQDELVLKDCDNDLSKVEAKMKSLSKSTRIPQKMLRYRELLQRLQNSTAPAFDLRELIV
jgi:hypothetical protein